jgi:hypothetical protein
MMRPPNHALGQVLLLVGVFLFIVGAAAVVLRVEQLSVSVLGALAIIFVGLGATLTRSESG